METTTESTKVPTAGPITQARLQALEERIRHLEDLNEILQVMASYGPCVDSGSARSATELWTEDGTFDVDVGVWNGRAEIEGMLTSDMAVTNRANGCAHVVSMPRVIVDGDAAVATGYMSFIQRQGGSHDITRQTANRWDFVRTAEGWRVQTRTNRLLDGSPAARQLLARSVTGQA